MSKRICWKKGMRLTEEILRSSDNCTEDLVKKALLLASGSRFGLLPSLSPFELTVDISKDVVEIHTLNCNAITKDGSIIEAHYDTQYTNTFETRVQIPENLNEEELILTIDANTSEWRDTNNGYEEPIYSFSLISSNSPVPSYSVPIARIVNQYGWRLDDLDFIPPCVYVTSHQKYMVLLKEFKEVLSEIDSKSKPLVKSRGKSAVRIFWPIIQQLMISVDKEYEFMSPMTLLANVQKCVSAFTCACELDDYLNLADADDFSNYVHKSYNFKNAYQLIKEGLDLCISINIKLEKVGEDSSSQTIDAPTISDTQLIKKCTNSNARIQVTNHVSGATVYYTTDGSEPTQNSRKGEMIQLDSGFNNSRRKEPDKVFEVKIKAIFNGVSSDTNIYQIVLQKDIEHWTGIEI